MSLAAREEQLVKMRKAHEVIKKIDFEVTPIERGYANRTLRIDLSTNEITFHPVTQQMKDLWTGGKGFDLWLMLQEIDKDTTWDSPGNPLCFASGPLAGTTSFPGSGKTLVTTISPLTNIVIDSNVGGFFGPYFKFLGFDALVIVGKAKTETLIVMDEVTKTLSIETCPEESIDSHKIADELTEMYADDLFDRRNISVVSAGQGADHTRMGVLNFSFYDWRRGVARLKQAGRGGVGTVFRDKNLKGLVVCNRRITPSWRVAESKVAHLTRPKKESPCCSAAERDEIGAIVEKWDSDREYVIEMMQDVQQRFRHIPPMALEIIGERTGAPEAQLFHIASFYKAFTLEPRGETTIQVCMGTTCHVKGSALVLDAFERELGVKTGQTTTDEKYSLEAVACLGACAIAPVVKIGEEVYGNVQARDAKKLLARYKRAMKQAGEATPEAAQTPAPARTPAPLSDIAQKEQARVAGYKGMLMVCTGTGCVAAKGFDLRDALQAEVDRRGLGKDYLVVPTGCNGFCARGPIIVSQPDGVFYEQVKPDDVEELVEQHLVQGQPLERLLHKDPVTDEVHAKMDDIGFFSAQQLIALRNKGLIDPEEIDQYIARGGYQTLERVLQSKDPEAVIDTVVAAGIRGRGGGGFPTGLKWRSGRKAAQERGAEITVVCNGDEGDPGAFMDRSIVETDPHSVIEGMLIGAFAVGAKQGFIYIRQEYPLAQHRLAIAIDQARERGILGDNVLGTGFVFDLHVHRGAGAFVCGESTALMASMEGRVGEPRAKYVHTVEQGFRGQPTVLNNVETWATIPVILDKGAEWFAAIGSGDVSDSPWNGSSGTKVFSLVGKIRNTGLVEVPMGIPLRRIIEDVGGGIPGGRAFKAVQTGGPSGGCLPADQLDMPVDFDSLTQAGSMMGSGAMIVMDDKTCMVDVARYFVNFLVDESCGKCTPCREGLFALNNTLTRICNGEGRPEDLDFLAETCETVKEGSLCQLGGSAPNPVLSTLRYFRQEYEAHIHDKRCPAGVCKALVTYSIDPDKCTGCHACYRPCPTQAVSGTKDEVHTIDTAKCIKCGICFESCRDDAVEVG